MEEHSERNKGNEGHLKESETNMQEDSAHDKVPCKPETSDDKCFVQTTVPEELLEKDVSQYTVPKESKSNVEQCKSDNYPVKKSPAVTMPGIKKKFISRIPQPTKKLLDMMEHKVMLSCGILPSNQEATGEKNTYVSPETRQNISATMSPINYKKQLKNEETQTETETIISPIFANSASTRCFITLDASTSNKSTRSRIAREKIAVINNFVHSADACVEDLDSITNLNALQDNCPEEDNYSHQRNLVHRETSEPKIKNQINGSYNLKSSSSGNLQAYASTSGFVSGTTSTRESPFDAESSNISLDSVLDEAEKVSSYNLTMIDAIRNVQYVLASMAFRGLNKCSISLPLEIRRRKRKPKKRTQTTLVRPIVDTVHSVQPGFEHFRRKHTYKTSGGSGDILERHWTVNVQPDEPSDNREPLNSRRIHNVVATIEHIEHILEMLLTVGYKITMKTRDSFGTSEVPAATHNAMSDVKTFLQPLKASIGSSVQGEYFRPLMDAVTGTLTPAFNHLKDAVIALESPARGDKHLRLKLEKRMVTATSVSEEMGTMDHVYNMANHGGNSSFLMNMMNMYNNPPGNNTLTVRPGHNRASVHPMGLMEFQFLHDIQVILTVDLGIIVFNKTHKKAVAISADGCMAGIKYRYGECMQRNGMVDISVINPFHDVEKRARIMPKGILFQDERSSITYLITNNNISTCSTLYPCIPVDFLGQAFYSGSRYGPDFRRTCLDMLNFARNEYTEEGTQMWIINNVQMKQRSDGQLILHKSNADFTIIISPNRLEEFNSEEELLHSARLTTPDVHVTCSVAANERGRKHHFFIRQENKKVYCSDQKFVVRSGNQSAGINKDHQITLNTL